MNSPTNYILEDSNFNFRYVRLCDLDIPRGKWLNYLQSVETLINSGDPDQMLHFAVSDLGLHCLLITFLGCSRLQWDKQKITSTVKLGYTVYHHWKPTFGSNFGASSTSWSGFNLRLDMRAFDGFPQITLPRVRSLASLVSNAGEMKYDNPWTKAEDTLKYFVLFFKENKALFSSKNNKINLRMLFGYNFNKHFKGKLPNDKNAD